MALARSSRLNTNSLVVAILGADINLSLALQSDEAGGAEALAMFAETTIARATGVAGLLRTGRSIEAGLAETRCSQIVRVALATILAVGTGWLGAVHTAIADLALTLARDTVAASVTRAGVGAHARFTGTAHETAGTEASTVDTSSSVRAVTRASLGAAVETGPAHLTHTLGANAVAVLRAVVGAGRARAIHVGVSRLAETSSVLADTVTGAVGGARLQGAVITHPAVVALACVVLATAMLRAIVRAHNLLGAVNTLPSTDTFARAIETQATTVAVGDTGSHGAIFALVTTSTEARTVLAVSVAIAATEASTE